MSAATRERRRTPRRDPSSLHREAHLPVSSGVPRSPCSPALRAAIRVPSAHPPAGSGWPAGLATGLRDPGGRRSVVAVRARGTYPCLACSRLASASRHGPRSGRFCLLLLPRFAFVWIGIYLGLTFYPNPEAVTAVRTVEFPIGFLGNPFVAFSTMPAWLGAIALWNPLSSTVSAAPPALRRPDWRPPLLDHKPRSPHGSRMAVAAHRRFLPAIPAPLPAPVIRSPLPGSP